jgi:exonuclease SbcD
MEALRRRFPHVLVLGCEPESGVAPAAASYASRVHGLGDLDLAAAFVAHVRGTPPDSAERDLLRDALEAGVLAEARAGAA